MTARTRELLLDLRWPIAAIAAAFAAPTLSGAWLASWWHDCVSRFMLGSCSGQLFWGGEVLYLLPSLGVGLLLGCVLALKRRAVEGAIATATGLALAIPVAPAMLDRRSAWEMWLLMGVPYAIGFGLLALTFGITVWFDRWWMARHPRGV